MPSLHAKHNHGRGARIVRRVLGDVFVDDGLNDRTLELPGHRPLPKFQVRDCHLRWSYLRVKRHCGRVIIDADPAWLKAQNGICWFRMDSR